MEKLYWVSKKYLSRYMNDFTFRFNNKSNENVVDLLLIQCTR